MKFNDLQPTKENLCEAFKNDLIGRNEDIKRFVKLLDSLSNSYSIALDGSWGSGKTFFVKQAKLFIDAHNEHLNLIDEEDKKIFNSDDNSKKVTYHPQVTVYYDAWENDNDSDPVLSLIYSIISSIDTNYKLKESDTLLNKAVAILEAFTGKNVREIASALEGKDLLDEIHKQKNLELNIKAFLNSLLEERGNRLIIFIDELDRCKPSFAVKLLERIKHYFTNDKITFVFSINLAEIQHTVKSYYGNEFDSCRYLDRFFDLRLSIPPIDMELFYTSIKFGKAQNVFSPQRVFEPVCKAVVSYYSLSLRETCRYLATCNMATHEVIFNNKSLHDYNGLLFCIIYCVPIMIGLKLFKISDYFKFIEGKDDSAFIEITKKFEHNHRFVMNLNETKMLNIEKGEEIEATLEDKLSQVYQAVFGNDKKAEQDDIKIGDLSFKSSVKEELVKIVSGLSKYMDIGE